MHVVYCVQNGIGYGFAEGAMIREAVHRDRPGRNPRRCRPDATAGGGGVPPAAAP